jgi:hypothetical protein
MPLSDEPQTGLDLAYRKVQIAVPSFEAKDLVVRVSDQHARLGWSSLKMFTYHRENKAFDRCPGNVIVPRNSRTMSDVSKAILIFDLLSNEAA